MASSPDSENLVIKVNQARKLPKTDVLGTIDAYFILKYGDKEHKTEVVKNNKNPIFNEIVTWDIDSSAEEVTIELWDWDKISKNDLIATGKFTVANFKNRKRRQWFPLTTEKGKAAGEVELEVVYNAYVDSATTRSFDLAPSGLQQGVLDYLKTKPLIQQIINFVYTSVIWEELITFGIFAAILLLNYYIIVTTKWRTLVYLFILAAELYVIISVLQKFTKFLDQEDTAKVEESTNTVVNYIFSLLVFDIKNPLDQVKALEKFQQTPYYTPTVVVVFLLLSALISGIFSGAFLGFIAVFGLLLAPGIHTKGLDVKFVDWWTPTVWNPILKPQWDKYAQPYVDKYVHGITPEPAVTEEVKS